MKALSFIALFLAASLRLGYAQNVVVNGGFDDDPNSFAPWVVNDPDGFATIGNDASFSQAGPNHADLTETPDTGSISQTLSTLTGQTYILNFWLANDGGADANDTNTFTAVWNGTTMLSLTNSNAFNYTEFTYAVLATSPSTVLEFDFHNDADFWRLDTVSATAAVPEPSVTWLALAGLPLLALAGRRARFAR
jgi:hypothetical protein